MDVGSWLCLQHQAELSIKERQVDSAEAERKMKDEQFKAELALKKRQADGDTAEHKLKEKQSETESGHKGAELALKERELDSKDADRTQEGELQKRQARDQMVDRCVRAGVAVGELVLPFGILRHLDEQGFQVRGNRFVHVDHIQELAESLQTHEVKGKATKAERARRFHALFVFAISTAHFMRKKSSFTSTISQEWSIILYNTSGLHQEVMKSA